MKKKHIRESHSTIIDNFFESTLLKGRQYRNIGMKGYRPQKDKKNDTVTIRLSMKKK
jgi:hypothetical protein